MISTASTDGIEVHTGYEHSLAIELLAEGWDHGRIERVLTATREALADLPALPHDQLVAVVEDRKASRLTFREQHFPSSEAVAEDRREAHTVAQVLAVLRVQLAEEESEAQTAQTKAAEEALEQARLQRWQELGHDPEQYPAAKSQWARLELLRTIFG